MKRPAHFDAVIFDLDGVVTDTARVHAAAWKVLFDEYLRSRTAKHRERFFPFDLDTDYPNYVDGKPRYDGVRSFLESRQIKLPQGTPSDGPEMETVCGLGNRKDRLFTDALSEYGVETFPTTLGLIRALAEMGIRCGIVSSSRNCQRILQAAKIEGLFEARVDGEVAAALGLSGKPQPDIFLKCAELMNLSPARCVIVEDAVPGVEAGQRGGFVMVIGLDRLRVAEALRAHGADVVVKDLGEVTPEEIDRWCVAQRGAIHNSPQSQIHRSSGISG